MFVKKPQLYQLTLFFSCLSFVIGSIFVQTRSAQAAPFTCSSNLYQIVSGQLRVLDPVNGTYSNIGTPTGLNINAMGYNPIDNYIYGIIFTPEESHLVRIESDGSYTDLGLPAGLPTPTPGGGFNSGDFDDAGNLYIKASADQTLYKIDVINNTATAIPLSSNFLVSDLVYINGYLYGAGQSFSAGNIYRANATDGTVTSMPITLPANIYGSGWATDINNLYFFNNTTGVVYKITNYTSVPTATPVMLTTSSSSNDGASCFSAPSPIPDLTANDKTNSTQFNQPLVVPASSGLLIGDTGENIFVTSYTQPSHGTVVVNPDGSYTYTPNADFSGTDTFTYTITDEFGNTATATVTITVDGTAISPTNTTTTGVLASTGSNQLHYGLFISILILLGTGTLYIAVKRVNNSL